MSMNSSDYRFYLSNISDSFDGLASEARMNSDTTWKCRELAKRYKNTKAGRDLVKELEKLNDEMIAFAKANLRYHHEIEDVLNGKREIKAQVIAMG